MKIKSAVLYEYNKPVVVEELDLADPKAGECQVKVVATGFCHSDAHVLLGEIPVPLPIVLGHETAGIITKVGPGVTKHKEGDRVVCSWMVTCGECAWCLTGRGNLCQGNFDAFLGGNLLDGTSRLSKNGNRVGTAFFIGGFSTDIVCPQGGLIPIPKEIATEDACYMGCCIPTGWGAVTKAAKAIATDNVAVWGIGPVGLNALRGAAMCSCYPIIAVDPIARKEAMAREFGATHFIDSSKEDPVAKIKEITGGVGCDFAIECIGDPNAIIQCFWAVKVGGKVIDAGITPANDTTNIPMMLAAFHERTIQGCLYGGIMPTIDIPKLFVHQVRGAFKVDKLTTKHIKLEDINDALSTMLKGGIDGRWRIMMD